MALSFKPKLRFPKLRLHWGYAAVGTLIAAGAVHMLRSEEEPPQATPIPPTPTEVMEQARDILASSRGPGREVAPFLEKHDIPIHPIGEMPPGLEQDAGVYINNPANPGQSGIYINAVNSPVLMAATITHEARHALHDKVARMNEWVDLRYTPSQEMAMVRYTEAEACATTAHTLAMAAGTNTQVREAILAPKPGDVADIRVAGNLYRASQAEPDAPPRQSALLKNHVRQAFMPCLHSIQKNPNYEEMHLGYVDTKTQTASLSPAHTAVQPRVPNGEINMQMQRFLYPGFSRRDAGRPIPDAEIVTVEGILAMERGHVRRALASADAAYASSKAEGQATRETKSGVQNALSF